MASIPDHDRIAEAFRAFVPDERFRKFLRILHTLAAGKGRLLAWQDFLWTRFQAAYPDAPRDFHAIADALCICPVHLSRMSREPVPVIYGYWGFPPDLIRMREEQFPFANYIVHGPDYVLERPPMAEVPVCRDCRRAMDLWNASRGRASANWAGEYFVVGDVFETSAGWAVSGIAANADIPWPDVKNSVVLERPDGRSAKATVLALDKGVMRSCFSDGSRERAILIARDPATGPPIRGTRVVALRESS